jgi:hypothetical protein
LRDLRRKAIDGWPAAILSAESGFCPLNRLAAICRLSNLDWGNLPLLGQVPCHVSHPIRHYQINRLDGLVGKWPDPSQASENHAHSDGFGFRVGLVKETV